MSVPTTAWSLLTPAGADQINAGDNQIRLLKTQINEVIDVDHNFPSSGSSETTGFHNKVTLIEAADIGSGSEGLPILGAQTISDKPELVYTDEDDNDIQITSAGKIKLSAGRLENNTNLTARNAAGDADVNIIKVNASNVVEVPTVCQLKNASVMESDAAPTTDTMIVNKKYVDDQIAAIPAQVGLGSWASATSGTAETDLIVVAYASVGSSSTVIGYTPNGTQRAIGGSATDQAFSIMFPVKKGDTWSVTGSSACYYISLGS